MSIGHPSGAEGRASQEGRGAHVFRPWWRSALVLAVLAAGLGAVSMLLWSTLQKPSVAGRDPANTLNLPAWLLLPIGTAGAIAGYALAWRRARESLRDTRVQHESLRQLLDVWSWRSDAQHRLLRAQPPRNASPGAWSLAATGRPLWERFENDAAVLQARLDAHVPIDDQVVHCHAAEGGSAWRLRAVPCFDGDGLFAGYVGTARPVDAERACLADQAALDALMNTWPGAVWLGEAEAPGGELRVRRCNEAAARLTGAASLSWPQMQAALPADIRSTVAALEPGAKADEGAWTVHLETVRGAAPGLMLALLPRHDAAAHDEVASDQASFGYTVSHDLRAPLRVVEGFTRILKEDYGRLLDRIGNDHLDRVLAAGARMNSMIDALLGLAQLSSQPLARQPVNLSQLAGFVVEDLRRQHPERRVEVHVQPGLTTHGDPTLLRLVLENLLGNAWKYTGRCDQPAIGFETETVQMPGGAGPREVFTVRDNGAGFDMRFADRLFGVFQRLHSANDFPGTGVGLASVRRIVRRHGGEIWAEAEVGRGARFYFSLNG